MRSRHITVHHTARRIVSVGAGLLLGAAALTVTAPVAVSASGPVRAHPTPGTLTPFQVPDTMAATKPTPPTCIGWDAAEARSRGFEAFTGTAAADVLGDGDATPDWIAAGGGDDIITTGPGDDIVCGGYGDDVIDTRAGMDSAYGDEDDDTIDLGSGEYNLGVGGVGEDDITGGVGADIVWGDDGPVDDAGLGGRDEIEGGGGADLIYGGDKLDTVFGGPEDDFLFGDDGPDVLTGGSGVDELTGGAGDDTGYGDSDDSLCDVEASFDCP